MRNIVLAAAVSLAVLPAVAQDHMHVAQAPAATPMPNDTTMRVGALSDAEYVQMTATSDMFEIEAGKLAAQKAQKSEVKQFGQMMVQDHTMASDKLKATLAKMGGKIPLPANLDAKHMAMLTQLQAASGAEFDRMYVKGQVAAHQDALAVQQSYVKSGDEAGLKQHATEAEKVVSGHLAMVEKMNQQLGS